MILRDDLVTFLNTYMAVDEKTPRIDPYLANGLQIAGSEQINKIVTGVSANLTFFEKAVAAGAQAVLVHHSLVPPASLLFEKDVAFIQRLKFLWEHDLSLIGF
ncbi:MAG: Nif3-like dinuclear metal center hexameric protein, partial [Chloroflexota bacterium]